MVWCAVLATVSIALSADQHEPAPALNEIVNRLALATEAQNQGLGTYSVTRGYSVRWKNRPDHDVLEVLWTYKPAAGKNFQVVKTEGSSSFAQKALREVVEAEAQNSHIKPDPASITPDHYLFKLVSKAADHYKLSLTPRAASKFLVNGFVLVDRRTRAIMRAEGKTSKRLSFWVGNADLVREYAKAGEFWLPLRTRSTARVRFIGEAELTIDSENYQFTKS